MTVEGRNDWERMLITYLYLLIMKEGMNSERRNEELKEGRKVSGSCAEILLTCTYLYLLKMKEGMNNGREKEWGIERRKEWLMREGMTEKEWYLLTLLELKNEGRNEIREKELREGRNNEREKEWDMREGIKRRKEHNCGNQKMKEGMTREGIKGKEWLMREGRMIVTYRPTHTKGLKYLWELWIYLPSYSPPTSYKISSPVSNCLNWNLKKCLIPEKRLRNI